MVAASDVTIFIPTRGRKRLIEQALKVIEHRPLIFIVEAREATDESDLPDELCGASVMIAEGKLNKSHFAINNIATSHVLGIDDDVDWPLVNPNFFAYALRAFNARFPDGYGVLRLNNGDPQEYLGGFFLIARHFYQDHCDWTQYECQGCDWEMSLKAMLLGKYAYCAEAILPHLEMGGRSRCYQDNATMRKRLAEFLLPGVKVNLVHQEPSCQLCGRTARFIFGDKLLVCELCSEYAAFKKDLRAV